ncbi:MAG: SPOCS domain-containing protein [Acutalibacteraceae bacterium]
MDLQAAAYTLRMTDNVYDDFEEKAVDMDFVLPDYCPDIAAVLKCTMTPVITARQWSADRLMVDGVTTLRVLYLDEDRSNVHSYEATQGFTASFQINGDCQNAHRFVSARSEYVNCRATGPRRVDIHGAFRVMLRVLGESSKTVFTDPMEKEIFCNTRSVCCSVPVVETEKAFTISEMIDIGEQVEDLVYTDLTATVGDCKRLLNKMIVKGCLHLKALYVSGAENTKMKTMRQEIPFSQIMDIDGLSEDWMCSVQAEAGESDIHLQQENDGGGLLSVSCKITAFVRCSRCEQADVVLDAYATSHPLACETMPLHIIKREPLEPQTKHIRQSISLPEGVCEVIDLWGEVKLSSQKSDENGMHSLEGCLLLSLLGQDGDGHIGYYERTVDMMTDLACPSPDTQVSLRAVNIVGKPVNGQLEIDAELEAALETVTEETLSVVSSAVIDEQETYPASDAALRIIYAQAGENLWTIAKSCRASIKEIMSENNLDSQVLAAPTVLMVPMS